MVLLIDANILLDVLMKRSEFYSNSAIIWRLCETKRIRGFVSVLTFANIAYVMRKELDPQLIEDIYKKLGLIFEFADLNESIAERAVSMKWKDFEDALQSATAEHIQADYIVTRNVRDFTESLIPAVTPRELLADVMMLGAKGLDS